MTTQGRRHPTAGLCSALLACCVSAAVAAPLTSAAAASAAATTAAASTTASVVSSAASLLRKHEEAAQAQAQAAAATPTAPVVAAPPSGKLAATASAAASAATVAALAQQQQQQQQHTTVVAAAVTAAADGRRPPVGAADVFPCVSCEVDADCDVSLDYRLSRTDGLYLKVEVNMTKVCVHKRLLLCNGPSVPEYCDLSREVCTVSQAFFDETARTARHSVCSSKAFVSRPAFLLSRVVPLALLFGTCALLGFALWALAAAEDVRRNRVLLSLSLGMVAAAVGTFWSPYMSVGAHGVAAAVVSVHAHCNASRAGDRTVKLRWLVLCTFFSLVPLFVAFRTRATLRHGMDGAQCSAFYGGYYEVDPLLISPSHNTQVRHYSVCSRAQLARSLCYMAAVLLLSFLLGLHHVVTLASLHQQTPVLLGGGHDDDGLGLGDDERMELGGDEEDLVSLMDMEVEELAAKPSGGHLTL